MIKNFLFVLKRFKTFSLLNRLGLSAAIFIFLIVAVQVHYDLKFNSSIPNHKNIFQIVKKESTAVDEKYNCNFTLDERDLFVSKIPEIKKYCFDTKWWKSSRILAILLF
ncbi:MAG: hypothetical protein GX905_04595 [Bacteroidales bacterium]|nr:hypothetical protein [Bacteroidales bacterium]